MNRTFPLVAASLLLGVCTEPLVVHADPARSDPVASLTAVQGRQDRLETGALPHGVESVRITPVVRAVRKAGPSVVSIQVGDLVDTVAGPRFRKLGEGSGVIVTEEGLVLTNWHVVRFKDRVRNFRLRVNLRDGRSMPGKVLNVSRDNDLALIGIRPDDGLEHRFPPITMGKSSNLMVGETVIAIGNPRGQQNTVTAGVLSAVNRSMSVTPRGETRAIVFKELLQTDAAINPGNSGGALLDITGKLIGINTLMQLESQNIGFAIPVDHVRKVFEDKLLNVQHLGIWTGIDVREAQGSLIVATVYPGSPAESAHIRRGDRILQVGDKRVRTRKEFAKALVNYSAGQRVPLYVGHGGDETWRRVVGWNRNDATVLRLAGMAVGYVDPRRDRRSYDAVYRAIYEQYSWDGGRFDLLRVRKLQPDGPAADLGLREGDLIIGVLDRRDRIFPFDDGTRELAAILEQGRGGRSPWLSIYRSGEGLMRGRITLR